MQRDIEAVLDDWRRRGLQQRIAVEEAERDIIRNKGRYNELGWLEEGTVIQIGWVSQIINWPDLSIYKNKSRDTIMSS